MLRFLSSKKFLIVPVLLFLFVTLVYISHLSQSVYGGDAGDFIGAVLSLGVAHPSGYPLFTLLGILANTLPLGFSPAWRVGLVSVLASSGSVVILYLLVYRLTKSILLSVITSTTLSFFYLFWLYAEVVEVFALNNMFFFLLLFLAVVYRQKRVKKYLYLISFFLGLSFSNHEITILLVPSLFILVLSVNWKILKEWQTVLLCFILFATGLLPYLYVPIAAAHNPVINWDNASTLKNFLHLVLRQDYSWSLNTQTDTISRYLAVQSFAQRIFIELTPAGCIIIFLGMIEMLRKKMFALFSALFLGFFLTGPFYVLYGLVPLVNDFTLGVLERFYLISSLFLIVFLPFGIGMIVKGLDRIFKSVTADKERLRMYHILFIGVFILLPFMLFRSNYGKTNLHNVWIGDYLGADLLSPLPQKSFLVLNTDNVLFNSQYIQLAKGFQKDIVLANLVYLPRHPLFIKKRAEITDTSLTEEGKDYQTILRIHEHYPIYAWTNFEVSHKKNEQFAWIPYGLGYKMASDQDLSITEEEFISQQEAIWQKFHVPLREQLTPAQRGLTIANIPAVYAAGYASIASYLQSHYGDWEKAKEYYLKSVAVDNEYETGYLGLGFAEASLHECEGAKQAFENVIIRNPSNKKAYISLFVLTKTCLHDNALTNRISTAYANLFGEPIQKAVLRTLSVDNSSSPR